MWIPTLVGICMTVGPGIYEFAFLVELEASVKFLQ
jgi:hypothetical protein